MSSVSFDRAAGFYDQTRGFPPGVADEVAGLAMALLEGRANALEIGVGTGRIAKPLLARGVRIIGVDLSRAMMARIRRDVPQAMLVNGDVTRLPLAPATCDAVIALVTASSRTSSSSVSSTASARRTRTRCPISCSRSKYHRRTIPRTTTRRSARCICGTASLSIG